ncbi:MAG TPA: sigma-70 family RNA polymerase sigma factor [Holophagaceae bacterium]|nr:sigma-70 family RNA polymerase sigma factor [Holophagaceae bacterium]
MNEPPAPSDEYLVAEVAGGSAEALQALHQRYAPLVFHVACKSLDRAAAEEITQDVFTALWTRAGTFDPARGTLKAWLLQIAHHRIVNELRTRSRRPRAEGGPERVDELLAHDGAPDEAVWREYQRAAVREAIRALPPAQRQALSLAYFQELSHEEVATSLRIPLGTAKTRIRAGLRTLGGRLSWLVAVGLLLAAGSALFVYDRRLGREDRALAMLTSSRAQTLRLLPPGYAGDPEQAPHLAYRGEPGVAVAVITASRLQPAPAGQHYELWAYRNGAWVDLGAVAPDASGHARRILEGPAIALWPEGLRLTAEATGRKAAGPGAAVLAWPPGAPGR